MNPNVQHISMLTPVRSAQRGVVVQRRPIRRVAPPTSIMSGEIFGLPKPIVLLGGFFLLRKFLR